MLTGLEKRTSRRGRVVNLHGVVGTWLLVGMLGLSVTGVTWSVLAGENVGKTVEWIGAKAEPIETEIDRPGEKLSPAEVADQAAVVLDTATAQGLTGQLRLFVPKDGSHAWQASERWVPWRVTSDAVSVDALPLSELPLFSKLMSWGIYLHMGIMFGLPLQIALALLALGICAMTVMGYVMWCRRGAGADETDAHRLGDCGDLRGGRWAVPAPVRTEFCRDARRGSAPGGAGGAAVGVVRLNPDTETHTVRKCSEFRLSTRALRRPGLG